MRSISTPEARSVKIAAAADSGISLEAETRLAHVRCEGHCRQVEQIIGPERNLGAHSLADLDEHVVVLRGRSGGDAVEHVPAANAAHEAKRRLHRHDLSRKASECA